MNIPREAMLRGTAKGKATQRAAYFKRLEQFLSREMAPLADRVPLAELLPVAVRIYWKAYDLGYHKRYQERQRLARKDVPCRTQPDRNGSKTPSMTQPARADGWR
jgi:hypothetical protein